jgi:hypothetical protein
MKIYNYHPISKEYTGESIADESPLEEGVYLIPAYATDIPPVFKEGKATVFSGGWKHVDAETIAEIDMSNTSPSSETAYAKVNKRYDAIADKLEELIQENKLHKYKINQLEIDIKSLNKVKLEV